MSFLKKVFILCGILSIFHANAELSDQHEIMSRRADAFSHFGAGSVKIKGKVQSSRSCVMGIKKINDSIFVVEMLTSDRGSSGFLEPEVYYSTKFDSNNCTLSNRKDKNGKVFKYKTCTRRRETFFSRIFGYDNPKIGVETISFRPIDELSSAWPIVDYEYKRQYEDPKTNTSRVVYSENCNMVFVPNQELIEIMNM